MKEENIDRIKNDRDLEEKENLKTGFLQIKESYFNQLERFKNADEKLNMILVFNAAILALNIVLFPLDLSEQLLNLFIIFISTFGVLMFLTLILIFLGLFPKTVNHIDDNVFADEKTYQCDNIHYYGKFIKSYLEAIKSIRKATEKKHNIGKIANILTILNVIFMAVLIVITQI